MLPKNYHEPYLEFQRILQKLQSASNASESWGSEAQIDFQTLQQLFQQMLNLEWDQVDSNLAAKAQSIHIEINKQLRLLSMDLMFLKSARQSTTATQRQQQMSDRIELLMRYGEGILGDRERVDSE